MIWKFFAINVTDNAKRSDTKQIANNIFENIFDSHVISTWIKNTVAKQQMITDSATLAKSS